MKASQAQLLADGVNQSRDSAQYEAIKKEIKRQADDGKYSVTIWERIRSGVCAKLQTEGYTVSDPRSGGTNETCSDVEWSDPLNKM